MVDKRRGAPTTYCIWCRRVQAGESWRDDRRRPWTDPFEESICRRCQCFYLKGFALKAVMGWCREGLRRLGNARQA